VAEQRRRGRRDNGLDAADWRAIHDLDPRMSEDVLDLLAVHGIAAYVQPAMDVDPVTRSATVPSRPSDRLFVDRRRADAARDYLRGLLPADRGPGSSGPDEVDAVFAGIVADFDRPPDPTAASWPASEEVSTADRTEPPPPQPPPPGPVDARQVTEPSLLDGLDTFGSQLPDQELPEQFVPPPPPPIPRISRQSILASLAILVGLVLVIGRPRLLPLDRNLAILLGFAAMVGGAVALIMRLRPGPDPDEPPSPDQGAEV
jgi:hypothetical protein